MSFTQSLLSALIFVLLTACSPKPADTNTSVERQTDTVPAIEALFSLPLHDSLFIDSVLNATPFFAVQSARVKKFYSGREFRPAWFNDHGLSEQAGEVVNLINDYLEAGIVDTSVFMEGISILYDSLSADGFSVKDHVPVVLAADILFTGQFFAFSDQAWKGRYIDRLKELEWFLPAKKISPESYLDSLLRLPAAAIPGSEPVFVQYHALRKKLRELVQVQKAGGWATIAEPEQALKPGDTSLQVAVIRKRLGMPQASGREASAYDSTLAAEIRSFQECHGIPATGITDKRTVRELNVPVETRIRKVVLNLERWKWVPPVQGGNFIAVNIPEFMLHVYENGKEAWSMKVIVGKNASRTVIFSGDIKYVVFAPYWNVPRSIVTSEILPAAKKNAGYLTSHKMEVVSGGKVIPASSVKWNAYNARNFPYAIRQKPGDHNSLGLVKFLFPNSYSIYLHDTPSKWLFEKQERDFSHGCIRLSEPQKLAEYLLRNDMRWDSKKIGKAMRSGREETVELQPTVPVHITYFTSWVDSQGRLNFRDDVYGHDRRLDRMMLSEQSADAEQ